MLSEKEMQKGKMWLTLTPREEGPVFTWGPHKMQTPKEVKTRGGNFIHIFMKSSTRLPLCLTFFFSYSRLTNRRLYIIQ
jgi:hypothetical protein